MASSIAGTALWRCPAKVVAQTSLQPSGRFSYSVSLQLSWRSNHSRISVSHLGRETLITGQSVGSAKIRLFHSVNCQQRLEEQCLGGSKNKSGITQSIKDKSGGCTKFLAITEGVCIVVAGASYTASVLQTSQQTATVASSSSAPRIFSKLHILSTWQVPALWAALVINALLRTMQMRLSLNKTERKWEETSIKDFTADERIGKLEDDVQSVAAIARMLSRHLEKLGVRFRVTRRTLRDPIQETATLALKTSEVVSALVTREDTLEAELRETRRELRETQQLLVSMQDSQEKQLELLVTAMTKTFKSQKAIEEKLFKDSARRVAGTTNKATGTGIGAPSAKGKSATSVGSSKSNFAKTLWGRKESYMKNVETPTKTKITSAPGVETEKAEVKKALIEDNQNGRLKITPSQEKPAKKITTLKPDTSFNKEDFWASTPATSPADLSVEHEVVDYLTSAERTSDAVSRYSDNPEGSGRLDSFFSGRKNINSYQAPISLSTQDYHNPGFSSLHSQSGDPSGDMGKHRERTTGFGFSFDNGYGKDKWPSSETSSEIASCGAYHGDINNWSNLGGGDFIAGSPSGSPRQSSWSSTSPWDFTSSSGSTRHSSWYCASSMDCSSGSGSPRVGEGIINFAQSGFVDTDFMRDFKDGYVSN